MLGNNRSQAVDRSAQGQRIVVRLLVAFVLAGSLVGGALWVARSAQAADGPIPQVVPLVLNLTVGTDPEVCAVTDAISVGPGAAVTYCYEVTNTGLTTLTRHDLVDSRLGVILNDFPYTFNPGASVFITQTAVLTESAVSSATWTAYNPGPVDVVSSADSVTVTVRTGDAGQIPGSKVYLPLVVGGD